MVNAWCHISIFQALQCSSDVLSGHILSRPRHLPLQPTCPVQKFRSVSLLCSSWLDVPITKLSVHHCCNVKYVHIVHLFVKYTLNKFWHDAFSSSINSPFCKHMFLIIHKLCMKESQEHPKGEFWRILLISFLPLSFPRDKLVHIASSFRAYLLLSMSVFLSVLQLLCLSGRGWVSHESGECEHRRKSHSRQENYNRCVCMSKSSERAPLLAESSGWSRICERFKTQKSGIQVAEHSSDFYLEISSEAPVK